MHCHMAETGLFLSVSHVSVYSMLCLHGASVLPADAEAAQRSIGHYEPCGASRTLLTIALAARVVQCAVHTLVAALKATCGLQA